MSVAMHRIELFWRRVSIFSRRGSMTPPFRHDIHGRLCRFTPYRSVRTRWADSTEAREKRSLEGHLSSWCATRLAGMVLRMDSRIVSRPRSRIKSRKLLPNNKSVARKAGVGDCWGALIAP
jgi:hypothetical protein